MANLGAAIQRVRRTRRELDAPRPQDFERYQPEYEAVFEAAIDLGGDPVFDDVVEWVVEWAHAHGRLPPPRRVRERARELCADHGIDVPRESPLRG